MPLMKNCKIVKDNRVFSFRIDGKHNATVTSAEAYVKEKTSFNDKDVEAFITSLPVVTWESALLLLAEESTLEDAVTAIAES